MITITKSRYSGVILALILFLSGVTPFLFSSCLFDPFNTIKSAFAGLICSLLIICFAIGRMTGGITVKLRVQDCVFIFYVVISAVALYDSPDKYHGVEGVLRNIDWLVVFIVGGFVFNTRRSTEALTAVVSLTALIIGVFGIIEAITKQSPFINTYLWGGRISVTFGAPTVYAGYLLAVFFIVQGGLLTAANLKFRLFYAITSVVIMVNIYESGTIAAMGSFLMVEVIFVYLVIWVRRKNGIFGERLKRVSMLLALLLVVLMTVCYYAERNPNVSRKKLIENKKLSMEMRFKRWDAAWNMFLANPAIGVGANMYGVYYPVYSKQNSGTLEIELTENLALSLLAETGVFGALSLMYLIFGAFFNSLKSYARMNDEMSIMRFSLGTSVVAVAVFAMFHFPLQVDATWPLFWVSAGGAWVAMEITAKEGPSTYFQNGPARKSWKVIISIFLMIAVSLFAALYSVTFLFKELFSYRAVREMEQQRHNYMKADIDKALALTIGKDWTVDFQAGIIYEKIENYEMAFEKYKAAHLLRPYNVDLLFYMSNVLNKSSNDNTASAISVATAIIELTPDDPNAYLSRAIRYEKAGNYREAVNDITTYLKKTRNIGWHVYYMLFLDLVKMGDCSEAEKREALWRTVQLNPDQPMPYYQMGLMFMEIGLFDRAVDQFEKAIEVSPAFSPAVDILNQLDEERAGY